MRFAATCAALFFLLSCSSHPNEPELSPFKKSTKENLSIESQQIAAEQKARFVSELAFERKTHTLSEPNRNKIQKLLEESMAAGKIQEIKVIAWADAEYPSEEKKKLSKEEQKVAADRNTAIQNFIKNQNKKLNVSTYSMAERPSSLKEFIGSSEARIKRSLEMAGIPTGEGSVKFPSKASKAIVMVVME